MHRKNGPENRSYRKVYILICLGKTFMELSTEEKTLLKDIMNDKYAAGPFTGMVFNAIIDEQCMFGLCKDKEVLDVAIKDALIQALRVRLIARELAK